MPIEQPKALVTADLHFSDKRRDAYRHDFQPILRDMVKREKVDWCFILGDLTELKDHHSAQLVNKVVEHIYRLSRICQVVVLKANHDYADFDHPFFEFLHRIPNVTYIGQVQEIAALPKFLFLPHTDHYKKDWVGIDFKRYSWVFTHNTFEGADLGTRRAEGIPLSVLKGARTISGDVHKPQLCGCVTYVGAPYLVDFGDDYDPRVVVVSYDGSFYQVKCPGVQKRLVEVNSIADLKKVRNVSKGDIVKVRVTVDRSQYDRWQEVKTKVDEWADRLGCVLDKAIPKLPGRRTSAAPHLRRSDHQLLVECVKRNKLNDRFLRTGELLSGVE